MGVSLYLIKNRFIFGPLDLGFLVFIVIWQKLLFSEVGEVIGKSSR